MLPLATGRLETRWVFDRNAKICVYSFPEFHASQTFISHPKTDKSSLPDQRKQRRVIELIKT